MAINHNNITVDTTPTVLCTIAGGHPYTQILIYNNDNSAIFIGDNTVTATAGNNQGLTVPKATVIEFWMRANDTLYAISAAGTTTGAVTVIYSDN